MDDTHLSREDELQLREALAGAPDDLKQHFCRCWPSVKGLLEWLAERLPGVFKLLVGLLVKVGDWIFKALDCDQKGALA